MTAKNTLKESTGSLMKTSFDDKSYRGSQKIKNCHPENRASPVIPYLNSKADVAGGSKKQINKLNDSRSE